MSEKLKYNYEEFACFLLIHGSYADLEFTDGEKAMINNRFGEENFNKIHKDYLALGDYQVLQTIMDYKGLYYPTSERKKELLSLISKVFIADGSYTALEKNLFHFLEKLL
jgi:hypothetical protein